MTRSSPTTATARMVMPVLTVTSAIWAPIATIAGRGITCRHPNRRRRHHRPRRRRRRRRRRRPLRRSRRRRRPRRRLRPCRRRPRHRRHLCRRHRPRRRRRRRRRRRFRRHLYHPHRLHLHTTCSMDVEFPTTTRIDNIYKRLQYAWTRTTVLPPSRMMRCTMSSATKALNTTPQKGTSLCAAATTSTRPIRI